MDKELINSIKDLTAAVLVDSTLQACQIHNLKASSSADEYKVIIDLVRKMWDETRQKIVS